MSEEHGVEGNRPERGWVWFDRWTEQFMRDESYPAIWDRMETDRYKPIIAWWETSQEGQPDG